MSTLLNVIAHFETTIVNAIDENSSTMELSSVATPAGNIPAGTYGFTIEEESTARREYVTGVVSGTTVTFVARDISPLNATTADASGDSNRQKHRKGASVKLTNFPALQRLIRLLDGTDNLPAASPLSYDGAVTPVGDNELVTKAWVLSVVTGGAITTDQVKISGDAGETIAAGDYIYFKESDGEWYKVLANDTTTFGNVRKGIAQGSGTDGNAINGGVLVAGSDKLATYTTGQAYYAQDAGGALGTSAGTFSLLVGVGDANGNLVIVDPFSLTVAEKAALAAGGTFGTPSSTNKFVTQQFLETRLNTFGGGADGDFDLDGTNTYSGIMSKSGNDYTLLRDLYAENLEIPTGCKLITDGWMVFVNDTISGAGTLQFPDANAGANGTAGTSGGGGGANAAGGASNGNGHFPNRAGTDGASDPTGDVGGLGNAGGQAATAGSVSAPTADPTNTVGVPFNSDFSYGVFGVFGLDIQSDGSFGYYKAPAGGQGGQKGRFQSQAGGGETGSAGGAGGGGASGGVVWLVARNWTGTFTIRAVGGDGGDAGNSLNGYYHVGQSTGGAGGAGGVAVTFYRTKTWTGSYVLTGGTHGDNGGGSYDYSASGTSQDGATGAFHEIAI